MIDRWASHRHNPKAEIWNKMAIDMFEAPSIMADPKAFGRFWSPMRDRTLQHYGIKGSGIFGTKNARPIVGYVDRQNTGRRFSQEAHHGVMRTLETFKAQGKMDFKHLIFEDMEASEQLAQIAAVDVE